MVAFTHIMVDMRNGRELTVWAKRLVQRKSRLVHSSMRSTKMAGVTRACTNNTVKSMLDSTNVADRQMYWIHARESRVRGFLGFVLSMDCRPVSRPIKAIKRGSI